MARNLSCLRLRWSALACPVHAGSRPVRHLDEPNPEKSPYHFTLEANHFSQCILKNRTPKSPGEEGLRDMRYIREIYRSAGIAMA